MWRVLLGGLSWLENGFTTGHSSRPGCHFMGEIAKKKRKAALSKVPFVASFHFSFIHLRGHSVFIYCCYCSCVVPSWSGWQVRGQRQTFLQASRRGGFCPPLQKPRFLTPLLQWWWGILVILLLPPSYRLCRFFVFVTFVLRAKAMRYRQSCGDQM